MSRDAFVPQALVLEPQLKERVWGGRELESFGKVLPSGEPFGESWEVSDVIGQPSRVARGPHRGATLRALVEHFPEDLMGGPALQFPLLVKLLDARQNLSIQIHPSDGDLQRSGALLKNPRLAGKTEAWIILEAGPGAKIVHGLGPGVTLPALVSRLRQLEGRPLPDDEVRALFRWVPVTAGDVVFVPAGTVHALGEGIVLLEVQQTSDITYRIYDWGRTGLDGKPRQLHLDESLSVGPLDACACPWSRLDHTRIPPGRKALVECDKFTLESLTLTPGAAPVALDTRQGAPGEGPSGFHILVGFDGVAHYEQRAAGDRLELGRGAAALVPAALGVYELTTAASRAATVILVRAA